MNVRKETVPPILFSLLLREIKVSCIMRNRSKAAIGFIFITILLDVIGFGIIIPVVPKLLSHMIQGTMSEASVMSSRVVVILRWPLRCASSR